MSPNGRFGPRISTAEVGTRTFAVMVKFLLMVSAIVHEASCCLVLEAKAGLQRGGSGAPDHRSDGVGGVMRPQNPYRCWVR